MNNIENIIITGPVLRALEVDPHIIGLLENNGIIPNTLPKLMEWEGQWIDPVVEVVTKRATYLPTGQLHSYMSPAGTETFQYDKEDGVIYGFIPNGEVVLVNKYNANFELMHSCIADSEGHPLVDKKETEVNGDGKIVVDKEYQYSMNEDRTWGLTATTTMEFTYDDAGNCTKQVTTDVTGTVSTMVFKHNDKHQVTAATLYVGDEIISHGTFEYDQHGNLVRQLDSDKVLVAVETYYNEDNSLVKMVRTVSESKDITGEVLLSRK